MTCGCVEVIEAPLILKPGESGVIVMQLKGEYATTRIDSVLTLTSSRSGVKQVHLVGEYVDPFEGYPDRAAFRRRGGEWQLDLADVYAERVTVARLWRGDMSIALPMHGSSISLPVGDDGHSVAAETSDIVEIELDSDGTKLRAWVVLMDETGGV